MAHPEGALRGFAHNGKSLVHDRLQRILLGFEILVTAEFQARNSRLNFYTKLIGLRA